MRHVVCAAAMGPLIACGPAPDRRAASADPAAMATATQQAAAATPTASHDGPADRARRVAFRVPVIAEVEDSVMRASVLRGRALLRDTRDSLPGNVANGLRCMSCHLDDGTRRNGMPWVGVYARFPQYRARVGGVQVIEDRINDCFERSMNGRPLPRDARDMRDIVNYLAFLSRGVPVGAEVEGQGLPRMRALAADVTRGGAVFVAQCARCHGAAGEGIAPAPPLWGAQSFNIGAGMSRLNTMASFVRHVMPQDRPGTLTDQQAYDVAAYVNSHPRPDFARKAFDWPNGDPPSDVAYPTVGVRKKALPR
jgi:thiosulfate dehydrogenase